MTMTGRKRDKTVASSSTLSTGNEAERAIVAFRNVNPQEQDSWLTNFIEGHSEETVREFCKKLMDDHTEWVVKSVSNFSTLNRIECLSEQTSFSSNSQSSLMQG